MKQFTHTFRFYRNNSQAKAPHREDIIHVFNNLHLPFHSRALKEGHVTHLGPDKDTQFLHIKQIPIEYVIHFGADEELKTQVCIHELAGQDETHMNGYDIFDTVYVHLTTHRLWNWIDQLIQNVTNQLKQFDYKDETFSWLGPFGSDWQSINMVSSVTQKKAVQKRIHRFIFKSINEYPERVMLSHVPFVDFDTIFRKIYNPLLVKEIYFTHNNVVKIPETISYFTNVEYINVSYNPLLDVSFLYSLTHLKKIQMDHTPLCILKKQLEEIQKQLPECEIICETKEGVDEIHALYESANEMEYEEFYELMLNHSIDAHVVGVIIFFYENEQSLSNKSNEWLAVFIFLHVYFKIEDTLKSFEKFPEASGGVLMYLLLRHARDHSISEFVIRHIEISDDFVFHLALEMNNKYLYPEWYMLIEKKIRNYDSLSLVRKKLQTTFKSLQKKIIEKNCNYTTVIRLLNELYSKKLCDVERIKDLPVRFFTDQMYPYYLLFHYCPGIEWFSDEQTNDLEYWKKIISYYDPDHISSEKHSRPRQILHEWYLKNNNDKKFYYLGKLEEYERMLYGFALLTVFDVSWLESWGFEPSVIDEV